MRSTGERLRRILQHWETRQSGSGCFIFIRCSTGSCGLRDRGRRGSPSRNWTTFLLADLKQHARNYHVEVRGLVGGLDQTGLEEFVEVPWFTPPVKLSRRHALTQAAMHSHYHRGQNATRLRELGGVPPMTYFIIWLRKGQPAAQWS